MYCKRIEEKRKLSLMSFLFVALDNMQMHEAGEMEE